MQAIADGCQRDTTKIYTGFAPNWAYVNDKDFPSSGPAAGAALGERHRQGAQRDLASRVASSDDPITHHSYDVNIDVTVDSQNTSSPASSRDATAEQGTIHLERESASYPRFGRCRSRATASQASARGSGTATTTRAAARRRSSIRSARPGSCATPGTPRRRARGEAEGDLFVSTDATPAGQVGGVRARDEGHGRVQDVLARRAQLAERQRRLRVHSALRARPRPAGRTSCSGASSTAAASTRRRSRPR